MSSEMYETLEEELVNLNETIELRLETKLLSSKPGELRKKLINELQRDIDESFSLLQQLESEVKLAPNPYRIELMSSWRKHRESVNKINNRYKNLLIEIDDNRHSKQSADPRSTVLTGRSILERTGQSISRSHAVAIETEQIGSEVIGELGTQRETLLRTKTRLTDTDLEISRSRKILRKMYLNMIYNKIILIGIIFIEICILCILIYMKFIK